MAGQGTAGATESSSRFGELLRRYRTTAGLSQEELAERSGLSAHGISDLERAARQRPYPDTVQRLADGLNLDGRQRAALVAAARQWRGGAATPPLTSGATFPRPLSSFVGRGRELAEVRRLLGEARLVTLTGSGGVGKTRLALQVGAGMADQFPDGIFFIGLGALSDPDLVLPTTAQLLGLRNLGERPLLENMKEALRVRHLLLVLDNFEQVLPAAPDVAALLAVCLHLKVLVTSRTPLRVSGEHEYLVPPLSLPIRQRHPRAEELDQCEAVQLFVQRARAVKSSFRVTTDTAPAVAEICTRLDGLPLAVELAAARVRLLPPDKLLERLERRLPLLVGGGRDLPARQQTLRDTIAWSYDLLDTVEQRVFRHLAVFVGGCTLEAAEAVCTADSTVGPSLLAIIESLVGKNLLRHHEGTRDGPRVGMLETVREYGLEQLDASGEAADVRRRHAEYYLGLAEALEPKLRGPEQTSKLGQLASEHDNLRAVLAWAETEAGSREVGLRLAGALSLFWYFRGLFGEGRRWLERMLRESDGSHTPVRAKALMGAGVLVRSQGDFRRAVELLEESVRLHRDLGDQWGMAYSQSNLGFAAWYSGEYARAVALNDQSLPVLRSLDPWGTIWPLAGLGVGLQALGEYHRAAPFLDEALALAREVRDPWVTARVLAFRSHLAHAVGDHALVAASAAESLRICWEIGEPWGIALALHGLGLAAAARGEPERGTRLLGAADGLRETLGAPLMPGERASYELDVGRMRAALGDLRFAEELAAGRGMALEHAIGYGLRSVEPDPPTLSV